MLIWNQNIFKKAIEDKKIHERPRLKFILIILDNIFTVVFTAEVVLKLLAYGPRKYFTDGWSCLDFAIVIIALLGIVSSCFGADDIPIFKLMRTLRALRPLRALSRFDGIRVRFLRFNNCLQRQKWELIKNQVLK